MWCWPERHEESKNRLHSRSRRNPPDCRRTGEFYCSGIRERIEDTPQLAEEPGGFEPSWPIKLCSALILSRRQTNYGLSSGSGRHRISLLKEVSGR